MLEYENQMFLDILHEDGLLVAARGLRMETVIMNLMKVYCDPGNLVLVLGASQREEEFFVTELEKQGVTPLPRVITSETTNTDREKVYLEGGVLMVSARILVVDLLRGRVPVAHVTGFVVLRAHKILESCQEAFALRLYRQDNKTGFIKAFSSSPEAFTVGFAKVDRIMKSLFVKNLFLWPRFHATVNSSLEKRKAMVVELHIPLTPLMSAIQTAVLDIVHFCVKEIKRLNPSLETDTISVENALSKTFHKLLQLQLDPVWHQLSGNTKQLLSDLKILRSVITTLTQSDSVRLQALLLTLRSSDYAKRCSGWIMLDSAETLFVSAKRRLYNSKQEICPEVSPKWETLSEVLKEIHKDSEGSSTVLVLVESVSTCKQLKQYLTKGGPTMLQDLYNRLLSKKTSSSEPFQVDNLDDDEDEGNVFTLSQKAADDNNTTYTECTQLDSATEPVVMIQQTKVDGDPLSLPTTLRTMKPKYIVMYDVDVTAIRQIEVYQSAESEHQIHVYFLIYGGSAEEQAYLTTLRREKEAFDFLIKEKSTMVVVADQEGKSDNCAELSREVGKSAAPQLNTRKGGNTESKANPRVIVDMREFRSELPSLLHRRGIDIDPVTLQIGDYILSPEMCVERKSISDLIGSLNSGRLYQQALAMCRHYVKPILLIEFDQNKPFALQGRYYLSSDLQNSDITAKLQLLTIHFPRLRLVWSPSPYATAQLFHELKEGKDEPVASVAAAVGLEGTTLEDDVHIEKYNTAIHDFVSKLPGVNTKNLTMLMNRGQSLDHLMTLSQEELSEMLSNSQNAELLYKALHKSVQAVTEPKSYRGRGRGRGFRKRKN
ncbi:DNA repair endonuclease XPF-like [Macrosteles quadrilineatus]|uniref:DNA repair endonuclease XPF-like n=1 Tax=Macrosteles quadrilineatus TaxID=74068 RepID=UPI0023E16C11|nr:DNA repair endonuclease XPF-like [Macrosteles quadrilineatus]